jgi:hypothetical protein
MRKFLSFVFLGLVLGLFVTLASCGNSAEGSPSSTSDLPEAVQSAKKMLAEKSSLPVANIQVKNYQSSSWPDDCLGFPIRGEDCTQESINGYTGVLQSGNEQYEFHADQLGEQVRLIPQAVIKARESLSQQTGISQDQIKFTGFEAVDWADSCLEIVQPGVMCNPAVTPGYFLQMSAGGATYEFHIDQTGEMIIQAQQAP